LKNGFCISGKWVLQTFDNAKIIQK